MSSVWLRLMVFLLASSLLLGCEKKGDDGDGEESAKESSEGDGEADWVTYTSPTGGYKVDMPGKPDETSQNVPTEMGDMEMKMAMHEVGPAEVYMTSHSDWPGPPITEKAEVMKVLTETADGMASGTDSEEIDREEVTLGEHPGLQFNVKLSGKMQQKARVYFVGNRLYQILSIYPEGKKDAKAQRFVESFALTE